MMNDKALDQLANLQRSRTTMARTAQLGGVSLGVLAVLSTFFIQLSGAVIANGYVIPKGENIVLQHPDGGLIKDVLLQNGDTVVAGQDIIRFDGAELTAEMERLKLSKLELDLRIASTKAALNGQSSFEWSFGPAATPAPDALPEPTPATIRLATLQVAENSGNFAKLVRRRDHFKKRGRVSRQTAQLSGALPTRLTPSQLDAVRRQKRTLAADRAFFSSRIQQIRGRISSSIDAQRVLREQLGSINERALLISTEIAELTALVDDQLLPRSRLTSLQRERLEIQQRLEGLRLEDTQLDGQIAQARKEMTSIQDEDTSRLWNMLQADEQEVANVNFGIQNLSAQLGRLALKAPVGGRVHELAVNNPGTVVQQGQVVVQIVPLETASEVSVQIDLANIDDISIGRSVRLRFDTFKAHAATELQGRILQISPDRSIDPTTGLPFYAAKIGLEEQSVDDFRAIGPSAGAPVTVMIDTQKRSLANYLLEPVQQAMLKSFTET